MKNTILVYIALFSAIMLNGQSDLEMKLFELPDVIFNKLDTPEGYESAYELKIKQPIDHNNPDHGHFYQRVFLSHMSYTAPTALITNGYGRPTNRITEVAKITAANQLQVEHRYFLASSPDTLDFDYLNFEQVTADLHHINQLFRELYNGQWLASGISKGGTTTIFYRYLYPDDVDVSIPYVAPVNYDVADTRIYDFFDKVGTKECRQDLYNYQIKMLEQAYEMKSYLKYFAKGQKLEFSYIDIDQAYEYAILEYPFSFWQWGHDCSKIPDPSSPTDTLLQHFIDIIGLDFYSDKSMKDYASHYYQSGTEMGYYGFEIEPFKPLIKHLDTNSNPSAVFMPENTTASFNKELTNKVAKWTQETDLEFIYINGANDTWSATAVPPQKKSKSLWYFMEGKHHGNARIKNLSDDQKQELSDRLSEWLSTEVEIEALEK